MADDGDPNEVIGEVLGLPVTRADAARLQRELDRITEAERRAMRQAHTLWIG